MRVEHSAVRALLLELAKCSRLDLSTDLPEIGSVFGIEWGELWCAILELERLGVATMYGNTLSLRDPGLREELLQRVECEIARLGLGDGEKVLARSVPDFAYYISRPPLKVLCSNPSTLLIIEERALRALDPAVRRLLEDSFEIVTLPSLRGRRRFFDWGSLLTFADPAQAYADLLSFCRLPTDAAYSLAYDLETGVLDPAEVLALCSNERCRKLVGEVARLARREPVELLDLGEEELVLLGEAGKALAHGGKTEVPRRPVGGGRIGARDLEGDARGGERGGAG